MEIIPISIPSLSECQFSRLGSTRLKYFAAQLWRRRLRITGLAVADDVGVHSECLSNTCSTTVYYFRLKTPRRQAGVRVLFMPKYLRKNVIEETGNYLKQKSHSHCMDFPFPCTPLVLTSTLAMLSTRKHRPSRLADKPFRQHDTIKQLYGADLSASRTCVHGSG